MTTQPKEQLVQWARTSQRYTDKELFEADGVEDWCGNCGDGEGAKIIYAPKGTPMASYRCSYEYEEYDTRCLQCLYDDWHYWENMGEEELRKMAEDYKP